MTASVAACLLVLQMIAGSLALAAEAAPARDALGSIICIAHPDAGGPTEPQGSHKLPACCLLGCNLFGPGLLAAAAGDVIAIRLEIRAEPISVQADDGPYARPETHPRNPRAPPLLG